MAESQCTPTRTSWTPRRLALIERRWPAASRDSILKRREAEHELPVRVAGERALRPQAGLLRARRRDEGAHADRQHRQDLRADAADDGAVARSWSRPTTSPPSERPTTSRKNWGEARFDEQPESDTVMDDIEALLRRSTASSSASSPRRRAARWPASWSSSTATATRARRCEIDCTQFGSGRLLASPSRSST